MRLEGSIESVELIFNLRAVSFEGLIFPAEIAQRFDCLGRGRPEMELSFQAKACNDSGIKRIGFGFRFKGFGVISNFIRQDNGNLIPVLEEEVSELFVIDAGSFHDEY